MRRRRRKKIEMHGVLLSVHAFDALRSTTDDDAEFGKLLISVLEHIYYGTAFEPRCYLAFEVVRDLENYCTMDWEDKQCQGRD